MDKVYLGDGVYAKHDETGISIYTSDGVRVTNQIFLEYEVVGNLVAFLKGTHPMKGGA